MRFPAGLKKPKASAAVHPRHQFLVMFRGPDLGANAPRYDAGVKKPSFGAEATLVMASPNQRLTMMIHADPVVSRLLSTTDSSEWEYVDSLRLDWSEQLEARVSASRAVVEPVRDADAPDVPEPEASADLPPALAAMVEDRREHEREAAEAAIRRSIVALPEPVWAEIQARAASVGVTAERLGDGGELRLVADLPPIHGVQPVEDDAEPAAT